MDITSNISLTNGLEMNGAFILRWIWLSIVVSASFYLSNRYGENNNA